MQRLRVPTEIVCHVYTNDKNDKESLLEDLCSCNGEDNVGSVVNKRVSL